MLLTFIPAEDVPCTICGAPAPLAEADHGPLCLRCFDALLAIRTPPDAGQPG